MVRETLWALLALVGFGGGHGNAEGVRQVEECLEIRGHIGGLLVCNENKKILLDSVEADVTYTLIY